METGLVSTPPADLTSTANPTLDCYLSSILAVAECVETACPSVGIQYYDQLVRIRRRLAYSDSIGTLEGTRESLETTLAAYAEQARRYCDLRSEDRAGVLDLLGEMEEVARDKAIELEPLIAEIRKRLTAGQQLATVDALTGLANRRELERQVNLRLAPGKQFCVVFFDIDDFGLLNETVGKQQGDRVLKQLAERLNTQIRARDVASRWLADEFIIILECDIENARMRSIQIAHHLRGPYTVEEEGRLSKLEIRLSTAATESRPGDTPRKIWLRLEEDFQNQNGRR